MAFELSRFKKINDRHKITVFAYIKEAQLIFPTDNCYYNIHDLIKQICTLYYASIHEWDPKYISGAIELNQEAKSIKHTQDSSSSSTFLKDTFLSGIHQWRFKIDKCDEDDIWTSTIGIWKTRFGDPPKDTGFTFSNDNSSYGFAYNIAALIDPESGESHEEEWNRYGKEVTSGDIVEMHCDMNKLELSFSVNGVDYGVAYKDIEKTEYKVAVNLYRSGDTVTLLD